MIDALPAETVGVHPHAVMPCIKQQAISGQSRMLDALPAETVGEHPHAVMQSLLSGASEAGVLCAKAGEQQTFLSGASEVDVHVAIPHEPVRADATSHQSEGAVLPKKLPRFQHANKCATFIMQSMACASLDEQERLAELMQEHLQTKGRSF